jgi:hypothetical protein
MEIEVTTTELEMLSSGEFKPKSLDRSDVLVKKVEIPTPVINHFFFVNVGRPWKWYSRLKWTLADWKALVEKETTTTWIGYIKGSPFGYIELDLQEGSVEIALSGFCPSSSGWAWAGFYYRRPSDLPGSLNPEGCGSIPAPSTINML